MKYKINLTAFSPSGIYYTDGVYETEKEWMYEVFAEVREMQIANKLPMLSGNNHSYFTIQVDSDEHPNAHPGLVFGNYNHE